MESEVGDALEPFRSDEASSRWLHTPVVPFLQKGQYDEGPSQAVEALRIRIETAHKGST
jgi:uncharacterized membrane protein YgcG